MIKNKIIKKVAIFCVIVIGLYIGINLSIPTFLRWYVNTKLGNKPVLHLAPSDELDNIVDSDYLATLKKHNFTQLEICLPKQFELYKEKKNIISFTRMNREVSSGVIMVSYQPSGFFMQWDTLDNDTVEKLKKAEIDNDYDFFEKVISARKENISNLIDVVFIVLKSMISPRVGNEENLKIYKYKNSDQKGFITANILDSEANYSCDIFDKDNNYFHIMIRTKEPIISLREVCTIIYTIKKL